MPDDVTAQLQKIGAELRLARVKAYLTQGDVGQLAGVSRQLVSRIEQGCNGEISAYFSVAAALNHRFALEEGTATTGSGLAALDFGSEPTPVDHSAPPDSAVRKTTRVKRAARGKPDDAGTVGP